MAKSTKPRLANFYNLSPEVLAGQLIEHGCLYICVSEAYRRNDRDLSRLFKKLESLGVVTKTAINSQERYFGETFIRTEIKFHAVHPTKIYTRYPKGHRPGLTLELARGQPYTIEYRMVVKNVT